MKESKGFNAATGTSSEGFSRGTSKFAGNHHMKTNSDALINKGRGPTVGNMDKHTASKVPPTSALPKVNPGKDMFTGTTQVRTPGGTRAWAPASGQNYKGNADSMNFGRGPTKGNE